MRATVGLSLFVAAIVLLTSASSLGSGAASPVGGAGAPAADVHASAAARSAPPPSAPAPVASGRGTFFLNYPQPTAPATNLSCRYNLAYSSVPTCTNSTGNPSITSTPSGGVVTAYTAFAAENPCSGAANLTESVIGVDASANGSVWKAPVYLDNPVCSQEFEYTSAMMPAIASLANGTLVLAYMEYNLSANASGIGFGNCEGDEWFPAPLPCVFDDARLVVTESYTGGATWTVPSVIVSVENTSVNASGVAWVPMLPSVAVTGDTVYVAWTNFTNASFGSVFFFGTSPPPSIATVMMVESTTGGTSWKAPVRLPTVHGSYYDQPTSVAYAPSLAVSSNGTVDVAYATNFTADDNYVCNPYFACGILQINESMDVVLAQSYNNGSTFSLATVASAVPLYFNGNTWIVDYPGNIVGPAPSLAIDPTSGEIYVAYAGGEIGNECFSFGFCYTEEAYENVWLANSTNAGANWTNIAVGDQALDIAVGANQSEYLGEPSVGVGANGTVYVNAHYVNDTVCSAFYACDLWTDLLFVSTDHGANFSAPYEVDPLAATIDEDPWWDGFTTSMTIVGGEPWFAWTQAVDPNVTVGCFGPSSFCYSQVIVSTPFTGVGVTTTLNETGLPTGYNWSVALDGNVRAAPAGTNLSVSGIPVGENVSWTVPTENATNAYGIRYFPVSTPGGPLNQTGNLVIHVDFEEEAVVNVSTVPKTNNLNPFSCGSSYYMYGQYGCADQNVTPDVGVSYLPVGVPVPYGSAPIPGFTFSNCGQCLNVSFLAWTGTGNGSWNSTVSNGTTTIYGPVNETVSYSILGYCNYGVCSNATYNYSFVETGLPSGTPWTMTFGGQTQTSSTALLGFNGTGGPTAFSVWDVPFNATYEYVGTATPPSPITALQDATELVTFHLERIAGGASTISATASGLPAGVSSWGFGLGDTLHATPSSGATYTVPNLPVVLNATSVYGPDGVGAYPSGFSVTPQVTGSTTSSLALGGTLSVDSPVTVIARYAPEYWLSATNSSGGTVSGGTGEWVHSGATVNLTATASAGFAFVGWTGTGGGSVTSNLTTIAVRPTGPVTELATFVAVVPTYSLSVSATGVPAGVPVTVAIGATNYTEVAPFVITGLVAGSYSLLTPTVYPNGTAGERLVVTSVTTSLGRTSGGLDVSANGTLTIAYEEQVTLAVAGSTNGTTDPVAGTYWEVVGNESNLTASPDPGFVFVSWNGTGPGSITTASSATIHVTLTGPGTEAAVFALRPATLPKTFTLTISETGLPTGTSWSASVGANGASGTGALVLDGLNGTYTILVSTVLGSAGVRYVPANLTGYPSTVDQNSTLSVTFSTQYELRVAATPGGTVTPSVEWVDSGTTVTLTATANASYTFSGWSGTGSGAYSGTTASPVLTVMAPVSEVATFVPSASTVQPAASGGSWTVPIVILVVLLVVGLVIGLLIGRSRRPPTTDVTTESGEPVEPAGAAPWSEGPGDGSNGSETPRSGGGGDDAIYGGGSS
jgi:hypothetical protein